MRVPPACWGRTVAGSQLLGAPCPLNENEVLVVSTLRARSEDPHERESSLLAAAGGDNGSGEAVETRVETEDAPKMKSRSACSTGRLPTNHQRGLSC